MALMKCPECKKKISDLCDKCPNCGYPIKEYVQNNDIGIEEDLSKNVFYKQIWFWCVVAIVIIVSTIALAFFFNNNKEGEGDKNISASEIGTEIENETETQDSINVEQTQNGLVDNFQNNTHELGNGITTNNNASDLPEADSSSINNDSEITDVMDDNYYLSFEKENNAYTVIGVSDNAPTDIIIPSEYNGLPVTKIGGWAFAYKENFSSIVIPDSITSIEECAFEQCYGLTKVKIGSGLSVIGKGAFRCTNITSIVIPGNVKAINEAAFENCPKLSKVTIENGVQNLGFGAFCTTAIESIVIPDSVTDLGYGVFSYCKNLSSVTIGKGILRITDGAFAECINLMNIKFVGTKTQWGNISFGDNWNGSVPATTVTCSDGRISLNGDASSSESQNVGVTSIKLNKSSLSLMIGETGQLTAMITPSNANNKNIKWSSSNNSVATVSSSGMVTAKGKGSAIITVTTEDGRYTASCSVTVTETASEEYSDVLIISDTRTISNQTIDTDVYITSTGVVTFDNVTVNGNVYCYGKLTVNGGSANNLYAYYWDLGGISSSCNAWDGTHGLVKGAFKTCGDVIVKDNALDYAFNKWGKK